MKFLLLLFLLVGVAAHAQYKGITKYDFSTYTGNPIQKGWLMSDSLYRVVYHYTNQVSLIPNYVDSLKAYFRPIKDEFEALKLEYKTKAINDQKLIEKQATSIGDLNLLVTSATDDNKKILKQFWVIGRAGIRLHKGTTLAIGIPAVLLGYMFGKSF